MREARGNRRQDDLDFDCEMGGIKDVNKIGARLARDWDR